MSNTFYTDLKFGQYYERLLTRIIKNDGYEFCNNKDYDVKMVENGKEQIYEVKTDRFTNKTNNICIEFECNNKPSGITSTKANRYAYFVLKPDDKYDLYIIPTKSILKRIRKEMYKRIICCGDNKMSKTYLFDKEVFKKYLI